MDNRVYYGEYSLKHWIDLILKKNIILPEYQRFFVWDEKKVETLIRALKDKQFVPPITIGAFKSDGNNQNLILDGQQRLTSIFLTYLGLFPDETTYKKAIETFADENDDEEEPEEKLDNVLEWKFDKLTEKGRSRNDILRNVAEGNYKKIDFEIDESFLETNFLGFSYLVPSISNDGEQQKYYSSVFRNINIQGQALLPQESRASLYFLDKDLAPFFKPSFSKEYVVKSVSSKTRIDFVRCLAYVAQYNNDQAVNKVARSYKPKIEKYYEEFIYSVISNDESKYGKFTDIFPNKGFSDIFTKLKEHLVSLEIPKEYPSIIDMDMYFFGLVNAILFQRKSIKTEDKDELKGKIEKKIKEFKDNPSHVKAPSNLGHLRLRISSSIEIYSEYAS
ncbi:uncharacterized protein DUF262 [Algoriphagus ratkowskyi]|uniref:DUF262 domain-containing protein n=1 Tax=Algoriphagus ratkowskyi TaxID=57028 RepID=A0A2W7REM6_9BACT|nr:DUF262 domain-containing protein [Algoriphagus ratkowskyi]PZX59363.1 uncharacterized protein DUF262 [Algoriphagus ratkowskyi]TXD77371.1 DUF262 domain-containing protein [Algoriphagus ratkowskyi]